MRCPVVPAAALLLVSLLSVPALAQPQLDCRPREGRDNYRTQHTLAIDRQRPDRLWIGVEYGGIFLSDDAGETWVRRDDGITGYLDQQSQQRCVLELGRVVVDPSDSMHVLVSRVESPGTLGMPYSEHGGVWETRNGGQVWAQLVKPGMNASGSAAMSLLRDGTILLGVNNGPATWPGAPDALFNSQGVVYRTSDGGTSWAELPTGAPRGLRAVDLQVDLADQNHLWLVVRVQHGDNVASVEEQWGYLESRDRGQTWVRGTERLPLTFRAPVDSAVAPTDFSHRLLVTQTAPGGRPAVLVTLDGGTTWRETSTYVLVARYDPFDPTGNHVLGYAPFEAQPGLFESRDAGVTWSRLADLPAEVDNQESFGVRISEIAWHATEPGTLFASGSGPYVWKSLDGGRNWRTIFSREDMRGSTTPGGGVEVEIPPIQDTTAPVFSSPFIDPDLAVRFYPFGPPLPSGRLNATWEIETLDDRAQVMSVTTGTVVHISQTSFGDFSVFIQPDRQSPWVIDHDHLRNVQVTVGQRVEPGQVLGTVGTVESERGRTELQINRTGTTPEKSYCPGSFGTGTFNEAYATMARRLTGNRTTCTVASVNSTGEP